MKHRWLIAWGIQALEMLAAGALASLSLGIHPALHAALIWAGVPLAGLFTALRAVRRGLNNYLAWLAPAPCLYAAHYAIWGFAPAAGAGLLTAFLALVGAAAGQVLNQRKPKR